MNSVFDLPPYWSNMVLELINSVTVNRDNNPIGIFSLFNQDLIFKHEDGTILLFRNAYFVKSDEFKHEVCILTEHNGYHIFPFYEADNEIFYIDKNESLKKYIGDL